MKIRRIECDHEERQCQFIEPRPVTRVTSGVFACKFQPCLSSESGVFCLVKIERVAK